MKGKIKLIILIFMLLAINIRTIGAVNLFQDDFENILFNNQTKLTIPTYEGSGQSVHPDIYYNPSGWNGYKYWMVMTPYPNGNDLYENPSIVVSNDGYNWIVPIGLINPIDPTPSQSYNSDPALVFKNGNLYLYYREVSGGYDRLKVRTSTDGIHWSDEHDSLELPNYDLVSPSIIYDSTDNKFYMWHVRTGSDGSRASHTWIVLRNSTDGINWGDEQSTSISTDFVTDRIPWHTNVEYIPEIDEYWTVLSAGIDEANKETELYFGYSTDKLDWNFLPGKIIGLGREWDNSNIYQSEIKYIDGTVKIWYSARNDNNKWNMGYAQTSLIDLKKNYHWIYKDLTANKGYFYRSSSQPRSGQFSAKLDFDGGADEIVDIRRRISVEQNTIFDIYLYENVDTLATILFEVVNDKEKEVGIGVDTDISITNYTYHDKDNNFIVTNITRKIGWHRFKIFVKNDQSVTFYIDGTKVGTLSSQFNSPLYFQISSGHDMSNFFIDDLNIYTNNPPVADAGIDSIVPVGDNCYSIVTLDGTGSSDIDGDVLTYMWTNSFGVVSGPTPIVTLPLGKNTIILTVDDGMGGTDSDVVNITAKDISPPSITSINARPNILWPPNHRMVTVIVDVKTFDNCAEPFSKIISVTSNEPENGLGDGDKSPDWKITGNLTVELRAERSGTGSGRNYTLTIQSTDDFGNNSTKTINVTVPHNR